MGGSSVVRLLRSEWATLHFTFLIHWRFFDRRPPRASQRSGGAKKDVENWRRRRRRTKERNLRTIMTRCPRLLKVLLLLLLTPTTVAAGSSSRASPAAAADVTALAAMLHFGGIEISKNASVPAAHLMNLVCTASSVYIWCFSSYPSSCLGKYARSISGLNELF